MKQSSYRLAVPALVILIIACSCAQQSTDEPTKNKPTKSNVLTDQMVMANLWMQASAEFDALCYQAFNVAQQRLDEALAAHDGSRPLAVVVDCDETVLATSRYGAWMIATGNEYTKETWAEWIRNDPAREVPGAGEFLRYAESRGAEVFYITNRRAEDNPGTLRNLVDLGFPFADESHLLAKTETSDKTARRARVSETHEIAVLLGDSLTDFDQVFAGGNPASRAELARERASLFGDRFIVLPNATYGHWEDVLYDEDRSLPDAHKAERRSRALDPWQPEAARP